MQTKIETTDQYQWAVNRVEELLPLVDDNTPLDDPNSIELEKLSNMVADYSDVHFAIASSKITEEFNPVTKEELLDGFDKACKEVKLFKKNKAELLSFDDMLKQITKKI